MLIGRLLKWRLQAVAHTEKGSKRLSYHHILDASCLTLGEAASREEKIARDVFRNGRQGDTPEHFNVFLTPEQFTERKRLAAIARKREHARLKAIRRAAEGKPYGQGAVTPMTVAVEREPLEGTPKWQTVGKPKPHGARPKGYVCATYTGMKR
jgi:hypothetical protein